MSDTASVHAAITEAQELRDAELLSVAYAEAADHYTASETRTGKGLATKYRNLAEKWATRAGAAGLEDGCAACAEGVAH